MIQLDQVTQANAGAATEMTATAEALSGEAVSLNERTAFFKLDETVAHASRAGSYREQNEETVGDLQARIAVFAVAAPMPAANRRLPQRVAQRDQADGTSFERLSA